MTTLYYYYDESGISGLEYNGTKYTYVKNAQGDVICIYDATGNTVARYNYDAWGACTVAYDNTSIGIANINPIRYRSYYYDTETGWYYLQSRYYAPAVGRFISPDDPSLLGANGDLLSYNLYAYCSNNPVNFSDPSGHAIDSVFDALSLLWSIADVLATPMDPLAWAGLLGDVIDLALPGISGLGELAKANRSAVYVITNVDDVVDSARYMQRMANAADTAGDLARRYGTYVVLYGNDMPYIGKGGFKRAITSAIEHKHVVSAIIWAPVQTEKGAFVAEYLLQLFRTPNKGQIGTFNKIWSPGKKIFDSLTKI